MSIKEALVIIRDNQIHRPKEFALLMWPNSEGWQRVHNVGHGASRGAAMAKAAGGYLGKLRTKELIREPWFDDYDSYYQLTDKGFEYITNHSQM